jgi:hypothetical protein
VVAATLAVLLVLVAGGAAYGWSVLQRPEVTLARAFDAAKSSAQGTMTVSVQATGTAGADAAAMTNSSLRYSWAPGTQQVTLSYEGKKVGTLTTTDTHLTLQIDPASLPQGAADSLGGLGGLGGLGALGALGGGGGGDVITALLDGKPVGVAIGPGSALQKALERAQQSGGSSGSTELSPAQIGKVVDSVTTAVKDNATVTEVGTDDNGTHYVATVPLKQVVDTAWRDVSALVPGGAAAGVNPDLSQLAKVTLKVDVWVKDGAVTRVEVPLGQAMADVAPAAGDARVVVVMSGEGVQPVVGPVTEVPDSLITMLTGNG